MKVVDRRIDLELAELISGDTLISAANKLTGIVRDYQEELMTANDQRELKIEFANGKWQIVVCRTPTTTELDEIIERAR